MRQQQNATTQKNSFWYVWVLVIVTCTILVFVNPGGFTPLFLILGSIATIRLSFILGYSGKIVWGITVACFIVFSILNVGGFRALYIMLAIILLFIWITYSYSISKKEEEIALEQRRERCLALIDEQVQLGTPEAFEALKRWSTPTVREVKKVSIGGSFFYHTDHDRLSFCDYSIIEYTYDQAPSELASALRYEIAHQEDEFNYEDSPPNYEAYRSLDELNLLSGDFYVSGKLSGAIDSFVEKHAGNE